MTPEETIQAYKTQSRRRLRWAGIAFVAGIIAAVVFHFGADSSYSAWKIGLIVLGIVFLPVIVRDAFRKDLASTRAAMKARKDLLARSE